MFCPRCGQEDKAAPVQCSSCGLELAPVKKVLAEAAPGKTGPHPYRAALGAGGFVALAVVLVILWILFFAVGAVSAEAFLPFLAVLTWIAAAILAVHLAFAWWRHRQGPRGLASV